MKLVRALIAAAVTLGAAATIQLASAPAASAVPPSQAACGACWHYIAD